MNIFPFFKKKKVFFSPGDQAQIVDAIRHAEKETSGEIRIYVESKNPFMDPVDRAKEIFYKLKMQNTNERNAVLLYIAMDHRELALFADEGIYQRAGAAYWNNAVKNMITYFTKESPTYELFFCAIDRHRVQRRFKGNEKDAWDGACAVALVWSFGGAVGIRPRSENRLLLTLIGDMKHPGYQDHALCRRVQMERDS